jgi:hypothetical protein
MASTDAYFAISVDDKKSTSRNAYYLGELLVSLASKKQSSILLSTTKAEYIAATKCCPQILWIKKMLEDVKIENDQPIIFF